MDPASSAELPDMAIARQIGPCKLLIDPAATQEAAMAPGRGGAGEHAALRSSEAAEDRTRGAEEARSARAAVGGADACGGGGILERTEMLSERRTPGETEVTVGVEALARAEMRSEAGAPRESGAPTRIRTSEREGSCSEIGSVRGRESSMGEESLQAAETCSEIGHVVSPREETLEGKQACPKTANGGNPAIEPPELNPINRRRANQEECTNLVSFSTLSSEQVSAMSSEQALVVSAVDTSQGDLHQKICCAGGPETVETSRAAGLTSHDDQGVVGSKVTIKCKGNEQETHIGSFGLTKTISEQVDNCSTRHRKTSIAVDASLNDVHMAGDGKEMVEEGVTTAVAPENYEACRSSGKGTDESALISQNRSDASQSGEEIIKEIRTTQSILEDDSDNTVERKAELEVLSKKEGLGSKIEAVPADIQFVDGERPIIHRSLLQKEDMVVEKACADNLSEASMLEEETVDRQKHEKMEGRVLEKRTNENQLEMQVETPSDTVLSQATGEPYGSVVLSLREEAEKIHAIGSHLQDESLSVKPELKTDSRADQLDKEPLIKEIAEKGDKQKEIGHVNAVSCAESSPSKTLPEEGRIHEDSNQINTSIPVKNGKEIERVDEVNSTFSVHAAVKSRDLVTAKDFPKVEGEESDLGSAQRFGESTMKHVKTVNDVNVGEGLMSGSFKIHRRYGDGMFIDGVERGVALEEIKMGLSNEGNRETSEEGRAELEKREKNAKASQKRKASENDVSDSGGTMNGQSQAETSVKKAKKKTVNVWAKSSTSRKGGKKNTKNGVQPSVAKEDAVFLTPVFVNQDKVEDGPDQPICLSRTDKAEKIELSENRLSASSTKGYRMVRATRGVQEGTWYFEILVEQLGPTGHTRLGWSTQNGDVQAPVGFDSNSYGYRDVDGSKVHVAVREPYGDRYVEGDVIGFYIHLPNGTEFAPESTSSVSHRGRPYHLETKDDHPKKVPGSEICFFRNGVCQGTAFKNINGGRYFPAASMYTMPKEPNCTVKFNFGPHFQYPPHDRGTRPSPMAMCLAPYHNDMDGKETTVDPIMNDPSPTPSIQRRGSHIYGSI